MRLALPLVLFLALPAAAMDRTRLIDPRLVAFLGDNAKVIQEATKVELLRFAKKDGNLRRVGNFPLAFPPTPVRTDLADAFRRAVLDAHNYELASGGEDQTAYRLCRFDPLLGLRFTAGKAIAEVLLSFRCNELGVVLTPRQKSKMLAVADNRDVATADLTAGRNRFLAIVRALLPDDPDVGLLEQTPTLSRLRNPFETALRVDSFRVSRLPFPADAHAHWARIPRGAQAANLYEISGEITPLDKRLAKRAAAVLAAESAWDVPLTRVGEGLATHALRFTWFDPARRGETSVDVLIGGGGQWIEMAELSETAGARSNRHILDAQPLQFGPLVEVLRDVFPFDKEFRE